MQVVREVADALRQRAGALVKRAQVRLQIVAHSEVVHAALESAEGDRQPGQLLADVVVQVARDTRPLGILGLDQPAGQVPDLPWLVSRAARLSAIRCSAFLRSVMSMSIPT